MRLSRSPFGSGLAIGPKNFPSSSSRLRRGYDKAPRGAIEVIHRHAAIGFVEAELRAGLGGSLVAHEDLLDLLGDDDDHDSGLRGLVDVFADVIDLAVIPARPIWRVQMQHRDAISFCKPTDCLTETITDALEQCWGRDWITKVLGQERDHLAAHLELGDVTIEIHTVKAFEVQHDMTLEDIVDVGCLGHPDTSRADRQTVLHRTPAHRIQRPELGGLRCVRRRTSLNSGPGTSKWHWHLSH